MFFEKMFKKMKWWDVGIIKTGVFVFTLWLVSLFPGFATWIQGVNHWIFLIIFILLWIRPLTLLFKK